MKILFGVLTLLSLLTFSVACSGPANDDQMQREEAMDGDDLRETDSYENVVPVDNDKVMESEE